jgi:hypothetical protein
MIYIEDNLIALSKQAFILVIIKKFFKQLFRFFNIKTNKLFYIHFSLCHLQSEENSDKPLYLFQ